MIYLASPYSHPDPLVRKTRFLLAEQCTAIMLARRDWVYSPIVHCHQLAETYSMSMDFSFWKDYNFDLLRRADRFLILEIPGWQESKGVSVERDMAYNLSMQIDMVSPEGKITVMGVVE